MLDYKSKARIDSFDEIREPDIRYFLKDTGKWVAIEVEDNGEFSIRFELWKRQLYGFVTHGNWVKTWKTFNGAKRYINREFSHHFNSELS